jgi:hypothetical protein
MSLADFPRGLPLGGDIPRPGDVTHPYNPHPSATGQSVSSPDVAAVQSWLATSGLPGATARRQRGSGRYEIAFVRTGADYIAALEAFRAAVADHGATGLVAVFAGSAACATVADELHVLGAAMHDAGLADDPLALIDGGTLAAPLTVACPVTGKTALYEFQSVAFCRNAANPQDPLYDPALSAPFTAICTTSDTLAFARFVHNEAMQAFGRPIHEMIGEPAAVEMHFRRCVAAWQSLATAAIADRGRAVHPARSMHLGADGRHAYAAHDASAFAALGKGAFQHEMPAIYAARLTAKWSANLFEGKRYGSGHRGYRAAARAGLDRRAV